VTAGPLRDQPVHLHFDGTQSDLDGDLGVYIELARSYQRRKKYPRG
jgi:hypothetical protein